MENRIIPVILNLCDDFSMGDIKKIHIEEIVGNLNKYAPFPVRIVGIRIGAETCGFLFSKMEISHLSAVADMAREVIKADNLLVNLVIPVVEQTVWKRAKTMLYEAMELPWLHAITVNDLGALRVVADYKKKMPVHDKSIFLGRYFDKRFRDPRILMKEMLVEESGMNSDIWKYLIQKFDIKAMEIECLPYDLEFSVQNISVNVHFPYSLVSSGQICEFSGIDRQNKGRFMIGNCQKKCLGISGTALHRSFRQPLIKSKNALYIKNALSSIDMNVFKKPNVSLIYTEL